MQRCIESIVEQTFSDFELLLIDDGSTDSSPAICDKWAAADPRIVAVHRKNGGLSAARNTGLDMARGEYLTFVDSDDYLDTSTLLEVMSRMDDSDLTEYPIWRHYGSGRQSLLTFEEKVYTDMNQYWTNTQAYSHTYACNKVYRRELFREVRYPAGHVFEDFYTLPQLLRRCQRLRTTSKGLYYYCWNQQGITASATGKHLRQLLEAHLMAGMPMDDRYYLHLLNIQMDVYEMTGDKPLLDYRCLKPVGSIKEKAKAIALNILGIKGICILNKIIHRIIRW